MNSQEIRKKFLNFFKDKEHQILKSASLIPENDPSVLFNTAGMQPLAPYLLGEKHPAGKRLASSQKCLRTGDLAEVGDNTHFTFFEMLGNWSLGDYFKKESLNWSWEFLTDKEKGLGLEPERIYATVFAGDENSPRDEEAYQIWVEIFEQAGIDPKNRIFFLPAENNWWSAGENGPCGPDSEIFYDRSEQGLKISSQAVFLTADKNQQVVEIWNNVFMEYEKKDGKVVGKLKNKNVDTGAGLERLTAILQNKKSPYETDIFSEALTFLEKESKLKYVDYQTDFRIILDHLRSAVFLLADGVLPGNKDQSYILRRLLRRAVVKIRNINFPIDKVSAILNIFIEKYQDEYQNLQEKKEVILTEVEKEISNFSRTLEKGIREFEKVIDPQVKNNNICQLDFGEVQVLDCAVNEISGEDIFKLVSTYGLPLEVIEEEAKKRNLILALAEYQKLLKEHNQKSATASAGKFKGGLGGDSLKIRASHTATHLLLAGLQKFLGNEVQQAGSNITEERIRFDFTYPEKVEREILDQVEDFVNEVIEKGVEMKVVEMSKVEAKESGVTGSFWEKYPDRVKVWILEKDGEIFSRELCGGPHIKNTAEIKEFGKFKIKKEQSSSAGVRRVRAELI